MESVWSGDEREELHPESARGEAIQGIGKEQADGVAQ